MAKIVNLGPTPPLGFCVKAARDGEDVQVQTSGLVYSEDGTELVRWLEALVSPILAKLKPPVPASVVDHLLAIVQPSGSATVYINEVRFLGQVRTKGAVSKGAPVHVDQVADFGRLRMKGIDVPPDAGIILMMSSGWRRGVFYDLQPIAGQPRTFDLGAALGAFWGYLVFEDRVKLTDEQWTALLNHGWFPFVGLKLADLQALLGHVDSVWNPDELLPRIAEDFKNRSDGVLAHARKVPAMTEHLEVLSTAVRHYMAGDVLSTAGLLYPRIEGMLRGHATRLPGSKYSQSGLTLAATVDASGTRLPGSLLLPERFKEFLDRIYFAPFDPANVAAVSRNSVSHGVAPESKLDLKAATIALLVVEQLLYLCGAEREDSPAPQTMPTSSSTKGAAKRSPRNKTRKKR